MTNHPNRNKGLPARNTKGLRDLLFDEIEELRSGNGDPTKSLAVANIAKQIINTAKVELEFHRVMSDASAQGNSVTLGSLELGSSSNARTANAPATAA